MGTSRSSGLPEIHRQYSKQSVLFNISKNTVYVFKLIIQPPIGGASEGAGVQLPLYPCCSPSCPSERNVAFSKVPAGNDS